LALADFNRANTTAFAATQDWIGARSLFPEPTGSALSYDEAILA